MSRRLGEVQGVPPPVGGKNPSGGVLAIWLYAKDLWQRLGIKILYAIRKSHFPTALPLGKRNRLE